MPRAKFRGDTYRLLECECGNAKRDCTHACDDCMRLDGETPGVARVVAELRLCDGPVEIQSLVAALGISDTAMHHLLRRDGGRRLRRVRLHDDNRARVAVAMQNVWRSS